jgi:hypothetical protein
MIIINGERWMARLVSPSHPALMSPNGPALGCCDDITKTIYISNSIHPSQTKKVLCHELVHAAMFAYDVVLTYEEEELIAEIMSIFGEEIIDLTDVLFDRIRRGRY